jgi:hypothetical protein
VLDDKLWLLMYSCFVYLVPSHQHPPTPKGSVFHSSKQHYSKTSLPEMSGQFSFPSRNLILPTVTTLLGLSGLTTGAVTVFFDNPVDTVRAFGLRPAASSVVRDINPFTRALVYTYATRNIGGALTTLGLTAFWEIQPANSIAATTARSCLGLSMFLGTVVAVGDAILVGNFAESMGSEIGD